MRARMKRASSKYHFKSAAVYLRAATILFFALFSQACGDSVQQTTNAYVKARPEANEASTLATLKTVSSAEQNYLVQTGKYGTFDQLLGAGVLDSRFSGTAPVVNGYIFSISLPPAGGDKPPSFAVNADPQPSASRPITGQRHYFMDAAGIIHYNDAQAATASDPSLK